MVLNQMKRANRAYRKGSRLLRFNMTYPFVFFFFFFPSSFIRRREMARVYVGLLLKASCRAPRDSNGGDRLFIERRVMTMIDFYRVYYSWHY